MCGEDEVRFEGDEPYEAESETDAVSEPPRFVVLPSTAWGPMFPFFRPDLRSHEATPRLDPVEETERQRREAEEYLSMN